MTNTFIMTSSQLKPGDVITDNKRAGRVTVESVTEGQIWYKTGYMPVYFVKGTDTLTEGTVAYTANGWRRWLSERPVTVTAVPVSV